LRSCHSAAAQSKNAVKALARRETQLLLDTLRTLVDIEAWSSCLLRPTGRASPGYGVTTVVMSPVAPARPEQTRPPAALLRSSSF